MVCSGEKREGFREPNITKDERSGGCRFDSHRFFAPWGFAAARRDTRGEDSEEQMLEIDRDTAGNVISVRAHGRVTGRDYEEILIPALEERIAKCGRVRILYTIGRDFSGVTLGAMWSDARAIIRHLKAIERAAVITDVGWMINLTRFFSAILPYPVRAFAPEMSAEAQAWIRE